jgi:hypothetical protein
MRWQVAITIHCCGCVDEIVTLRSEAEQLRSLVERLQAARRELEAVAVGPRRLPRVPPRNN